MQVTSDAMRQIQSLSDRDGRYKVNAYLFALAGLDATLRKLDRRDSPDETARHVTGRELSWGLRDFALSEFGPSAKMVLDHWGIRSTLDFGHIVYNLISVGLMGKNDSDRLEDFDSVFDFSEELERKYRFNLDSLRAGVSSE